eukprot:Nitzschia sp. Nitz4//scaffold65_size103378//82391//86634//NITZ4_004480-RA/size103378-processed-gene-0.36-mRNA-1//1//CDS//3329556282//7485//frame0
MAIRKKDDLRLHNKRVLSLIGLVAISLLTMLDLGGLSVYLPTAETSITGSSALVGSIFGGLGNQNPTTPKLATIAYAVTVTGCAEGSKRVGLVDGAAVLHQSIRLVSLQSKYDYEMLAFVHPEAIDCMPIFETLGYNVQIRETPFNETLVPNEDWQGAKGNSCCGAKEYLKLYSYVQFQYPVVVHLDMDCLVLQPLDDVFDLMLDPTFDRTQIPVMWHAQHEIPKTVDFVFTRDYGMVPPGRKKPHQIGVQGGFLIVRPNQTDYDRYVEILRSGGNYSIGAGWGGPTKGYGGYYGASTIQGLASYYYGEFARNRSVELNRCYYNQMVDNPYGDNNREKCTTTEETCQDCRETKVDDVFTTHFTNCGKPFWCANPTRWWNPAWAEEHVYQQTCMDLFRKWHLVRLSLEQEWKARFPDYRLELATDVDNTTERGVYLSYYQGHCTGQNKYLPLTFPQESGTGVLLLPKDHQPLTLGTSNAGETEISEEDLAADVVDQLSNKTAIAFAVTVTDWNPEGGRTLLDNAAVLKHSVDLASKESRYDYHMLAFVHPDAQACATYLSKLGYQVQIRDTPFNETEIENQDLIDAQRNSCCGAKEYLKLYSYAQEDYPAVVHLDLDTIVLKPLDGVFDLMLDSTFDRSQIAAMWLRPHEIPDQVDFLFTRDYNMVDPPRRQPHQIGVQGGFLVVRPNMTDFQRYVDIILSGGNFRRGSGWGGTLAYGGYYGAGTIQGLASFYYGHHAMNRSVELNRCYYNTMVDDPMGEDVRRVYNVKESGLEYQHLKPELPTPKDGEEFLARFREGFEMNILENTENELVFEMIGCDTSFANALRRILLAEVPTVALESIYMWNNTSLIHDEVLAHRLGLVPLNVDARLFDPMEDGEDPTDRNTVVMQMKVTCPRRPAQKSGDDEGEDQYTEMDPAIVARNPDLDRAALGVAKKEAIETPGRPYTKHVYSRDLKWVPQGDQEQRFPDGIRPVFEDILLAKLRPGQEIELEAHGRVGIGRDHAKYSPVATACYRLYTEVTLLVPVYDADAEDLVHLYEPGVFELVPTNAQGHKVEAKVVNCYACTNSRNYMRNTTLAKAVKMTRVPHHFIFSVESVGMQKPGVLVAEALRVLQGKCESLIALTKEQEEAF